MKTWIVDIGSFSVEAETYEEARQKAREEITDGYLEIDNIEEIEENEKPEPLEWEIIDNIHISGDWRIKTVLEERLNHNFEVVRRAYVYELTHEKTPEFGGRRYDTLDIAKISAAERQEYFSGMIDE